MKKIIILSVIILSVIILGALLLALNAGLADNEVFVNGIRLERVDIYKYDETVETGQFDISDLKKENLIKSLSKSKDLEVFKSAFYENAEMVNPKLKFSLTQPDFHTVIYFSDKTPIRSFLWLGDGNQKGSYLTGTKLFNLTKESTKALYRIIYK